MDIYSTLVNFFQAGGLFMYPIVAVLALGTAIAIERYVYLTAARATNQRIWKQVMPLLMDGKYGQATALTEKSKAALSRILRYGLDRAGANVRREDIEKAMEEGLMEVMPRLEKRTHYLATFANIATLLGLLGTIIGLIRAFTAVSNANPAEKADLLSASISVAMNTTAFGLMVAIPLLLMHTVLQTKTTEIVDSLEMASVKFLNAITERSSGAGRELMNTRRWRKRHPGDRRDQYHGVHEPHGHPGAVPSDHRSLFQAGGSRPESADFPGNPTRRPQDDDEELQLEMTVRDDVIEVGDRNGGLLTQIDSGPDGQIWPSSRNF